MNRMEKWKDLRENNEKDGVVKGKEDMYTKLTTMFNMQMALDKSIYKKHNAEYDYNKTLTALMDEVGELIHELKGEWCWWKKTQKPVEREKVLEELVDCWHFAMMIDYHENKDVERYIKMLVNDFQEFRYMHEHIEYNKLIIEMLYFGTSSLRLLVLGDKLGFKFSEVYDKYLDKNAVNYRRLKEEY